MIYKVLIADDNAEALKSFNYQLKEHEDIKPILVDTAAAALEEIKKDPRSFAAAVLDFNFDDENINGADLALEIQKINKNLRIIICTGDDSRAALKAGYEARVHGFIAKDDTTGFIESLRSCFPIYDEFYRLFAEENKSLKAKYEDNQKYIQQFGMIGRSDNLRSICEIIDQSKDKKSTVLIRGESGTGKELVAKAFHEKSIRADKRFVAINCAALPHNLLESELFGHKRGLDCGRKTGV